MSSTTTIDSVIYTLSDTNAVISGFDNGTAPSSWSLIIQSTVTYLDNIYNVTSIENYAFNECTVLTSINIPSSVTSIGYAVFNGCTGLTSINIPSSITSIEEATFAGCTGLTSINIPSSVTSISGYSFSGCAGLTSITIPSSVTSIADTAFPGCTSLVNITVNSYLSNFLYVFSEVNNVNMSWTFDYNGAIPDSACTGRIGLTSVTIGSSITSIGYSAFIGCAGLTSITIPSSVTSIGVYSFNGCTGLTSITIPSSVTNIGDGAFEGCTSLVNITINSFISNLGSGLSFNNENMSWTFNYNGAIPNGACNGKTGLTSVTIGSGITSITSFSGCRGLTSITIPNSVTSIGENSFNSCTGLTSITIPSSVTSIGNWAFEGCTSLVNITVNSYLSNLNMAFPGVNNENMSWTFDYNGAIPEYACSGRTGLTSVTIVSGITSIDNNSFSGCTGLTSITIPSSVTSIGENSFNSCTGLTSITIPSSVVSVGAYTFYGCTGLTSITIPSSVTSIGNYALFGCTSLVNITINSYLSNLNNAFPGLNNENMSWTFNYNGAIPDSVCNGKTGLTSVTIGSSITSIGTSSFQGCSGLTSITIPSSVTIIGDYAFSECTTLVNITVNSYLSNLGSGFYQVNNENMSWTFNYNGAIPNGACNGRTGITSVTIGSSITSIEDYAFSGCTGLTSITIPNSIKSIGDYSFYECSSLNNVIYNPTSNNLPSDVTYYNFNIILNSDNSVILNGYFIVINSTNFIKLMYSRTDISSNILAQYSYNNYSNNYGNNHGFDINMNQFGANNSTNINSIPALDSVYNALEWQLYDGGASYRDTSNSWIDLPADTVTYSFTQLVNPNPIITNFTIPNKTFGDAAFSIVDPSSNSDGSFSYSSLTPSIATVSGNIIRIIRPGTVNIRATQDASGDYISGTIDTSFNIDIVGFPICFPAGTPVVTDQGEIAIEKIDSKINTVRGKKIVAITKTITIEDKIVCIEKDALGKNIPSQKTLISRNHRVLYNKKMVKAKYIIGLVNGVYNKKYNGEVLYNVLLETHEKMIVNNLIVETLDPSNVIAKLYNGTVSGEEKNNLILLINKGASEYMKVHGKLQ